MLELLFLLLPIAAACGWHMGRDSIQQNKKSINIKQLSDKYIAKFNSSTFNQHSNAVNLLFEVQQEDISTFDAQLILGNLFRSRGEIERAIHVHQTLFENSSLSFQQKLLAIQQLGSDYLSAGVYDRARNIFLQLIKEEEFKISALRSLLTIYQATSDWHKAIEIANQLVKMGNDELKEEIAHFYCELALLKFNDNDITSALLLLNKAARSDKNCARVSIIEAQINIARNKYKKAIFSLKKVFEQDKDLVGDTLSMLYECYYHLSCWKEWEIYLQQCVSNNCGANAELYLAEIIEKNQGIEQAQEFIKKQLISRPTMKLFHKLIDYYLIYTKENKTKETLILLHNMVGEQIRSKPDYRCRKCGFTTHALYWYCLSCRSWDTIKPIKGLDGQ
uniref:Lipopolysaccharide assembly protein B n=1 Tax=Candidatus Aschnera chinzeii TaxID=1485666 RepID=A0AAT9G5E8_9ENTR|nr:MAG: lipopolysaccharide assembly protein LapB [Candidatus Aschnera chinzeii]